MPDITPLSPTCKPIGFWLSVRETHSAHPILTELENQFGSYFERLTRPELHGLLTYSAAKSDQADTWSLMENSDLSQQVCNALDLVDELEGDFQLGLAKFLVEVISARGNQQ